VLGGTFNPIHRGHLHIAGEIQKIFSLAEVHFVVSTTPPHKVPGDLIPFTHRYAMVSLATAGISSFIPSLIELEPEASPFSVDTMSKLAHSLGRRKGLLYFIAGGDSLPEVKTWRESEKLLTSYNFIFATRPGSRPVNPADVLPGRAAARVWDLSGLGQDKTCRVIEQTDARRIYILNVGAPDISATQIRALASSGKSIQRMVPKSVREYIDKLHLYGGR
jgi:nicotinate-nucleotide adenylyltransferase